MLPAGWALRNKSLLSFGEGLGLCSAGKNKFLPLIFLSHSCFCNSAIARGSHRQEDPAGINPSTENVGLPELLGDVGDKSGEELLATGPLARVLINSGSRKLGKRGIQRMNPQESPFLEAQMRS